MTLVVDASLAVKWVMPEEGQEAAQALLSREADWVAPDFLLIEIGNVLRTKLMRRQIDQPQLRSGFALVKASVRRFIPDRGLIERAFEMAVECGHTVYDCMYLSCAEQENTQVATADTRFINKLRTSSFSRLVRPLSV